MMVVMLWSLCCDLSANKVLWGRISGCVDMHAAQTPVVPVAPRERLTLSRLRDIHFSVKQSTGRKFGPTFSNSFKLFLLAN